MCSRKITIKLLAVFLILFMFSPLMILAQDYCEGDLDCDRDVDATDVTTFLADFGRSQYNNPCPLNCHGLSPNTSVLNQDAIEETLATIGTDERTLVLCPGLWTIESTLTIPSNVTIKFQRGAILDIQSGAEVIINGPVDALLQEIFRVSDGGAVSFGVGYIHKAYPEWWGAVADGNIDCSTAIQAALDAFEHGGKVELGMGTYIIDQTLELWGGTHLVGQAMTWTNMGFGTLLKLKDGATGPVIKNNTDGAWQAPHTIELEQFRIDGNKDNGTSGDGIYLDTHYLARINRVWIGNCARYGMYLNGCNAIKISDCEISGNGEIGSGGGFYAESSQECNIVDTAIEFNENFEVKYTHPNINAASRITGCWFETNPGHAVEDMVVIDSRHIGIQNCRFNGYAITGYPVRFLSGANHGFIQNCSFQNFGPAGIAIKFDAGTSGNISIGNNGGSPVTSDEGDNWTLERDGGNMRLKGRIVDTIREFPADDPTPSVAGANVFKTSSVNTTPLVITGLPDSAPGQRITIIGGSNTNLTTIINQAPFLLSGDITLGHYDTIELVLVPPAMRWTEISRSNNY